MPCAKSSVEKVKGLLILATFPRRGCDVQRDPGRVLSTSQPQRWGQLLRKWGNSRKREFGEAPCVSRRGERSWSVKGEGNDAAQRYSARKTRLGSEKRLPQARCPRCRGAEPDRKMPCSMWPVPGKGVLSNQKCTLNTPRVHSQAPSGLEVPQQRCRDE